MNSLDRHYAKEADRVEGRDHDVAVAYKGRMYQSEGATGRAFLKFKPGAKLIWITDADGVPKWLTETQSRIASLLITLCDAGPTTIRSLAARLSVSPSTVSRAMVKLASYGLIAYVTGRGRYGGTVVIRRKANDGLDRFRKAAKAKVRAWSLALQRRILSTKFNVATYVPSTTYGVSKTVTDTDNVMVATLTPQLKEWTPDELRSAGIL